MVSSGERPNINDFLDDSRGGTGPCKYVRLVPEEVRSEVSAKVAEGLNRWAAFAHYIGACGYPIEPNNVAYHYLRGHREDR